MYSLVLFILQVLRTIFFMVKQNVFAKKAHMLDKLKDFISQAFMNIDAYQNWRVTVCHSVEYRFQECYNIDGGHFKHISE